MTKINRYQFTAALCLLILCTCCTGAIQPPSPKAVSTLRKIQKTQKTHQRPSQKFAGIWIIDSQSSETLDPYLKALGVGWLGRKVVDGAHGTTTIYFEKHEFVISDKSSIGDLISRFQITGEDKTVKDKKGHIVRYVVNFYGRSFRIILHMPKKNMVSTDYRELSPDNQRMIQILTLQHPDQADVIIKRVFIRQPHPKKSAHPTH